MKHIITSALLFVGMLLMVFFYAPMELNQGVAQKIFYIHLSSALAMYLGFFISFLFSASYLIKKNARHFFIAHSALEVAYVFCLTMLVTGPLWAKPIWGVYWTWEPRLTTTFIMWLMYSGYLLLYSYFQEVRKRGYGILSAISLVSFINVPLVHLSVKLWRGVHPSVIRNKDGLPESMQLTLVVSLLVMLVFFFLLLRQRFHIYKLENSIEKLRQG
ncbi:MAG: cytochrome c biogenesis protein CcsA [Proteobacteria bacterium]|jgi:heme exporter protein C|nr:cytochrome c biogenesis protein CcsA [Pseudomonadota bacterium]